MKPAPHRRAWVSKLSADDRGAVSVLRVCGDDAIALVSEVFRPFRGVPLAQSAVNEIRFGRIGQGNGDEVVAVITSLGPPDVEIHCHAGVSAIGLVLEAVEDQGASLRAGAPMSQAEKLSPIALEAIKHLAMVTTGRMAELLLDQFHGALDRELTSIIKGIEYNSGEALASIEDLLARWEVGSRAVTGWSVALIGPPNAGKSRLFNALAGYHRSIVDKTAGTTRDVVTARVAIDGYPVELADLAGIRTPETAIEAMGISLAEMRSQEADRTIVVVDRSVPLEPEVTTLIASIRHPLIVANKADLDPVWDLWDPSILPISAERGDGIQDLIAEIGRSLVPAFPEADQAVPFRPRHWQALDGAKLALEKGHHEDARNLLLMCRNGLD